ncbi:Cfr10I/Bse634I family restriction endonuclease [Acinetobacter baumannii]
MQDMINRNSSGKYALNPKAVFIEYMKSKNNIFDFFIGDALSEIEALVTELAKNLGVTIDKGAFNKCNGDWYEWLLSIRAIEFFITNKPNTLLINLPNISSFDVMALYKPELCEYIFDLREKLKVKNVNLITSNPDFCIVRLSDQKKIEYLNKLSDINFGNLSLEMLEIIDTLYKDFINYAELDDIAGYLSVKTSLRPDRRLQLAHEGSLMKALYTHLQTRTWSINPKGIKYFGASKKIGAADREGLKTVATHSITDVKSLPQSAVDELFQINSKSELDICLSKLLYI